MTRAHGCAVQLSTRLLGLLAVFVTLSASSARAAPSYGTVYGDGRMAVVHGQVSELSLTTAGSGTGGFQVTLPTDYATAEIFLTGYTIQFDNNLANPVRRVQVLVKPDPGTGGYDPVSGTFDWVYEAALQAYPVPTNSDAWLNLTFTIILSDETAVMVARNTLTSFSKVGGGTCDSSFGCENTATLTGVGATNVPFRKAFIGGFDVRLTTAARALSMDQLSIDTRGYSSSGNDAIGATRIRFQGINASNSNIENVTVNGIQVVSVARDTTDSPLTPAAYNVTNVTGIQNHANFRNSPTGSNAQGAYMGLEYFLLDTNAGTSGIQALYADCGQFSFSLPFGTTGRVDYQDNYAMLDVQPSPTLAYDAWTQCHVIWIP